MTMAGIIGDCLRLMRAALWVLFPIAFAGTAALEIIMAILLSGMEPAIVPVEDGQMLQISGAALLMQVPVVLVGTYMNLLIMRVTWAYLRQEPLDVGRWAQELIAPTLPAFIATICVIILVGFGIVLFILPGLLVAALCIVVLPVMVVERIYNPVNAIIRSKDLVQGDLMLLCGLIFVLFMAAFGLFVAIAPLLVLAENLSVGMLVQTAVGSMLTIFAAVLPTVIYAQVVR